MHLWAPNQNIQTILRMPAVHLVLHVLNACAAGVLCLRPTAVVSPTEKMGIERHRMNLKFKQTKFKCTIRACATKHSRR